MSQRAIRSATILITPILFVGLRTNIASAAELFDIVAARPCSAIAGDRVGASGNCSASANHRTLSVNLTARQIDLSAHPEDAPLVTLDLPDTVVYYNSLARRIAVDSLMLYNGSLAPEVWRVSAGSTLDVKLVNRLSPGVTAATNLHTHGLLVSPDLDTRGGQALEPVGDTVYVCTIPEGSAPNSPSASYCAEHAAYFGAKTSEMNYRLVLPTDHPEGLFWYHPHVHMNARTQVSAGLSGLIFVEATSPGMSGGARTKEGSEPVERFMMLKDYQIGAISATDPSLLKATFLPADQHDAGLCGGNAPVRATCFKDQLGWLFTVNGQLYPHVTIKSGGREVWRIANTSADMTYDLALVERDTGRPLRMQLLARDGVAAAQESSGDAIMIEHVLMMPSARIEVMVDRSASDGLFDPTVSLEAVLKTYGYYTGGDAWPAVDLAAVTFDGAASVDVVPDAARRPRPTPVPATRFEPMVVSPWAPATAAAPAATPSPADSRGDERRALGLGAEHTTHAPGSVNDQPVPLPVPEECNPLEPGEERVITLAIDKSTGVEKFKIGAARANRRALTPKQWDAVIQKAISDSAQFGDAHSPLLCAHAGTTEIWNIVNYPYQDNHETHNFHIHQTKFEVVDVDDPQGRIKPPRGGPTAKRLVDNYPVPIGGSIRIRIGFNRNQVGGRFVFHRHILEHEDKGMMAQIEVVPK